ncbi:hypothetical protein [Ralstonia solanacearum]|uniref:hypothetical protein n=2 Tax=Ralstonia pseudosolanacearum TaxID=1310165 RepID=UPI00140247FE|nr:hypothetical protein HI802_05835 [Ralstonia solanacearum]QKL96738.1 hypothetical protein HI801_05835 [Ralstonia solanacearum]QLR09847.1 hypothetical protein H1A20_05780 [Ralstonia solanacearum]
MAMIEAEQIAELQQALNDLVMLHRDWDKGTAYVTVEFKRLNDYAIQKARVALCIGTLSAEYVPGTGWMYVTKNGRFGCYETEGEAMQAGRRALTIA